MDGPRPLWQVAASAVELQEDAELVIAWCAGTTPKTADLARRGGATVRALAALRQEAAASPHDADREELAHLVAHHEQVVEQALRMAFRPDSPARARIAEHFRDGLGEPAERLRRLAQGLAAVARGRRWLGGS